MRNMNFKCQRKSTIFRASVACTVIWGTLILWNELSSIPEKISVEPFIVKPHYDQNQWDSLPNLKGLAWPNPRLAAEPAGRRFPNGTLRPLPKALEPVMSRAQLALSKRLLKVFADLLFRNGLGDRFMLNGGTLVGSFQHHDIVPWDDDVDVLADITVRQQIQHLLKSMEPDYLTTIQGVREKFYTKLLNDSQDDSDLEFSRETSRYSWGWPYLDIGYFEMNATHLWDVAYRDNPRRMVPKTLVFPYRFRPLGTEWYPAPYDTLGYLQFVYGKSGGCAVFGYSHVLEGRGPSGRTSCWSLGKRYAFVQHVLCNPNQYAVAESEWRGYLKIAEESLVFRSAEAPLIVHTILLPTTVDTTEVNTYGFADINQ